MGSSKAMSQPIPRLRQIFMSRLVGIVGFDFRLRLPVFSPKAKKQSNRKSRFVVKYCVPGITVEPDKGNYC